jgi:hypothetical protein
MLNASREAIVITIGYVRRRGAKEEQTVGVAVFTILRQTTNTLLRLEVFLYGLTAASVSKREQGDAGDNG